MAKRAVITGLMLVAVASFSRSGLAQEVAEEIEAPSVIASSTPLADGIASEGARLAADPQGTRPVAIEYSDAHETRAKIHKYASWATVPLMATEFALGESLKAYLHDSRKWRVDAVYWKFRMGASLSQVEEES